MSQAVLHEPITRVPVKPRTVVRRISLTRSFVAVVATVLLVFLALEGMTRAVLVPASKDFSRFAKYDRNATRLLTQSGARVALIGNSTTQFGVDTRQLARELQPQGVAEHGCDMFVADASKINTWYYICNRYFWSQQRNPELYVVSFFENNVYDGNPVEVGRLAQFFTRFEDWPEVLQHDLTSLNDRGEFVVSSFWMTLAARERIKQRVMKMLVPGYEDYTERLNQTALQQERSVERQQPERPRTLTALKRFLDRAKGSGAQFCFVAFPTRNCVEGKPYPLAPEVVQVIRDAGFPFVDLRHAPELKPNMYRDELHLEDRGRELYTRKLAAALAPMLTQQTP